MNVSFWCFVGAVPQEKRCLETLAPHEPPQIRLLTFKTRGLEAAGRIFTPSKEQRKSQAFISQGRSVGDTKLLGIYRARADKIVFLFRKVGHVRVGA